MLIFFGTLSRPFKYSIVGPQVPLAEGTKLLADQWPKLPTQTDFDACTFLMIWDYTRF